MKNLPNLNYGVLVNKFMNKLADEDLKVGDKVKLRPDALQMHSRSLSTSPGYTHEQVEWRNTLKEIGDSVGEIKGPLFSDSNHVNVQFNEYLIGIDKNYLIKIKDGQSQ